jgi:hypothetical protein
MHRRSADLVVRIRRRRATGKVSSPARKRTHRTCARSPRGRLPSSGRRCREPQLRPKIPGHLLIRSAPPPHQRRPFRRPRRPNHLHGRAVGYVGVARYIGVGGCILHEDFKRVGASHRSDGGELTQLSRGEGLAPAPPHGQSRRDPGLRRRARLNGHDRSITVG